jgi:signal transduction histidine kinase
MRRLGLDPRTVDAIVAVLVCAAAVAEILALPDPRGPVLLNVLGISAATLPLAVRRRAPLGALLAIVTFGALTNHLLTSFVDGFSPFVAYLAASYGAGAFADGRRALAGLAVGVAGVSAIAASAPSFADFFFPMTFMAGAWLAGRTVRNRSRLAAELHEAAVVAEEAHEAEASRAVAEERRRIAREMHDVVAHSMSVMVVQAGGARRILRQDTARADAAGEQIERTGREALAEMRRMLGFLRAGEDDPTEPQPGLERLDALVARTRDAGLPVTVRVVGEPRRLSSGLDLTAYRIVQEGLTNALKHAGPAHARLVVRYAPDALEVQVVDDGAGGGNGDGSGLGLAGLRERVAVYGGVLEAGARPQGGYALRARLPLGTPR